MSIFDKLDKNPQPAKRSYYFGKGYTDLLTTIKTTWQDNLAKARDCKKNSKDSFDAGFWSKFGSFYWLGAAISVLVFGSITIAIISLIHAIVLTIVMFFAYVLFTIVWFIDLIYLRFKKIFATCPDCKEKMLIPTYKCPKCGREHTSLRPGMYGIFTRKCLCGNKMKTTFLNGRGIGLTAICPKCKHELSGDRSRPICIPIVGGPNSGKTTFITAFAYDFREKLSKQNNWTIKEYDREKSIGYKTIQNDYLSGKTPEKTDIASLNETSAVSVSFILKGKEFNPSRVIHVYDIAGESFTGSSDSEIQRQYEYCHGLVIIVDPFSIYSVYLKFADELSEDDVGRICQSQLDEVLTNFLSKLHDLTGLSDTEAMKVPTAVVITKVDTDGLKKVLGAEAIKNSMKRNGYANEMDVEDYICRKFLRENGLANAVNIIESRFPINRYFACSAIGHSSGSKYVPIGVMDPMQWLFNQADPDTKNNWNDKKFTNRPALRNEP